LNGIRIISAHTEPIVFVHLHSTNVVLLLQTVIIGRETIVTLWLESERQLGIFLTEFVSFYQQTSNNLHISLDTLFKHYVKMKVACKNKNEHFFVLRPIFIDPSLF
jgi:hypothetical protein